MSITIGYDCIRANISRAPAGLLAGYTTGTPDIRWTAADWAEHPGAVRIDQDAAASDPYADVLDVERGAATLADVGRWAHAALASYREGRRPGQRSPLVYASAANLTPVANALVSAGLADGSIGLFVADWNYTQAQAVAEVLAANGPFPVHAMQFADAGPYDVDVFSSAWLNAVSQAPMPESLIWNVEPVLVKTAEVVMRWQHDPSIIAWQVHAWGPGLNETVNVGIPQATFRGLQRATGYAMAVVSLVGDHSRGTAIHARFRTAAA